MIPGRPSPYAHRLRPRSVIALAAGILLAACSAGAQRTAPGPPGFLLGAFEDDYGIRYEITDAVWTQLPASRYVVERWDPRGFVIARNHPDNVEDGGLWTRIDWVRLPDMHPWEWGFCLTVWDASSPVLAEEATTADPSDPRTGCNGFPYSRMKRPGAGEG